MRLMRQWRELTAELMPPCDPNSHDLATNSASFHQEVVIPDTAASILSWVDHRTGHSRPSAPTSF